MEIWRNINEYENYEVSNLGNVRNKNTSKILKSCLIKGYYYIKLCKDGKSKNLLNHRLVALSFIDNVDNKLCVDHIDGNKTNNNINNLRYATKSENAMNSKVPSTSSSGCKGINFRKDTNMWRAYITVNSNQISLGCFNTFEEAKEARIRKANEIFGEFKNICEN